MNLMRLVLLSACIVWTAASWAVERTSPDQAYLIVDGKVDRVTYTGWQVFNENCARCHGVNASGTDAAPDLTERINRISPDQFRVLVLNRYFVTLPLDEAVTEASRGTRQAIQESAEKSHPAVDMPRWRDNPDVRNHIRELYAYLTARGDGVLPPGVPDLLPE
ncbi:MAG: c-type cytochrome [Gammaproteobacteria bacterium]|nr:c-type cytochrome [Gammaproteobacteria bacterium]